MSCIRKHILKSKTYFLSVFENQMLLSENMSNSKYVIQFDFQARIMWKKSDHDQLCSFGIYYQNKIKWFQADNVALNNLKMHLSPRVFFGNISIFYESSSILGSGASSKVCLVKRKADLLQYAAKCISKKYLTLKKSQDRISRLQSEISILQKIDHPIFIKLLEIYEGDNSYYLLTDLLEGDTLYSYIRNYKGDSLPNHEIRDAIRIILLGLEYLESMDLIHRDIKLENIILASKNNITSLKIIDFGLALYESSNTKLSICGTPGYIAPEVLRHSENADQCFTTKCDVFSAGVIFYKLLTKKTLFRAENTLEIMEANKQCNFNFQDIDFRIQKEALNLLRLMLNPNPAARPLASECLKHPYFSCKLENNNIIQEILDKATGFSAITQQREFRDSHSVPDESQAAQIKNCPPTQYRARVEQRKRTRSPRKYAEFQFYLPSFCQMNSVESDGKSSNSSKISRIENIINEKVSEKDSVIEENNKQE